MSRDMDRLQELLELWTAAEARLKRTERVRSELVIPAVNELRYTGFHLVQALAAEDEAAREEALTKAARHCRRATYDAVEAEVLHWLDAYDGFRSAYSTLVLTEVSGFEWLKQERVARGVRNYVREASQPKEEYYEGLIERCDELVGVLEACEAARDELNKILRAQAADQLLATKRWRIGAWLAAVTAAAAVGTLAYYLLANPSGSRTGAATTVVPSDSTR